MIAEIIILVAVAVTMAVTAVLERGQERVHEAKARRRASGDHFQPPNLWPAHSSGLRVEQVLLVPHVLHATVGVDACVTTLDV